ncbi:MAG: methyltransferase domain-containing protein [Nitrospira sp.]|nr:MAG: methyltransferase domain-containing protein [Nitrospira sp.]
MPRPDLALSILLINDRPDEIKLVTSSLRGFFGACRIEAAYTAEEGLTFSRRDDWQIIILDHNIVKGQDLDLLARIRRAAPAAAILLQTNHNDSQTALEAIRQGADFLLFKQSAAFVTELLFSVQEALEKRTLQTQLDHTFQRHLRITEILNDLLFELDREGRFIYVSLGLATLLGYQPEELAGRHFSVVLSPAQAGTSRYHVGERRAGGRSTQRQELVLLRKASPQDRTTTVSVEISAKGLYDHTQRYVGTIGALRDLSPQKDLLERMAALESRLHEADHRLARFQDAALVSRQLHQPLASLIEDSKRLLQTLQHRQIEQQVTTIISQASRASQLNRRLALAALAGPDGMDVLDLTGILQSVVDSMRDSPQLEGLSLVCQFTPHLPMVLGSRQALEDLVRVLLAYAHAPFREADTNTRIHLQTETTTLAGYPIGLGGDRQGRETIQTAASFQITGSAPKQHIPARPLHQGSFPPEDFLRAHRIVQAHGGTIQFEQALGQELVITVRIPEAPEAMLPSPAGGEAASAPHDRSDSNAAPQESGSQDVLPTPPDRRRFPRRSFSIPVQFSVGTTMLRGVLRNMSAGGALLTLRDLASSVHLQPAYVVIRTPVSFLELEGVVQERPLPSGSLTFPSIKDLVISFTLADDRDRTVLLSLLDALREGAPAVTFEALILPRTTTSASHLPPNPILQRISSDRRETIRVTSAVPIDVFHPDHGQRRARGLMLNLGRDGACIELFDRPETWMNRTTVRFIPVGAFITASPPPTTDSLEQPWAGRIIWTRAHGVVAASREQRQAQRIHLGVRFERLSSTQERHLHHIMAPRLATSPDLAEPAADPPVVTTTHLVRNRVGHTLVLNHDRPKQAYTAALPMVVLSPGYGHTQQAYVRFAYYLASQGIQVLRYDHSRHIGLSDGDPAHTTYASLEDDLDAVLAFAHDKWPDAPLTLLASDLSAGIAVRRRDWQRRANRFLLLNPTLDLEHCLTALHQRNILQEYQSGVRFGSGNLLGLPLAIDQFLADALAGHYGDATVFREHGSRAETDIIFMTDAAVHTERSIPSPPPELLNELLTLLGPRCSCISVPSTVLLASGAPSDESVREWQRLAQLCRLGHPGTSLSIPMASLSRSTGIRLRFERDLLCTRYGPDAVVRNRLYTARTELTTRLDDLPVYWRYLDDLYQCSQPFEEGVALLDIGCGMHSFVTLLFLNCLYRLRARPQLQPQSIRYVGLDFSVSALQSARAAALGTLGAAGDLLAGSRPVPTLIADSWVLAPSIEVLPFADRSFDRIVANLSLSFAPSPLHALREFVRLLKPGGKLVAGVLTDTADLAVFCRPYFHERGIDEFTGDARRTLDLMAQWCHALRVGQLHTFDETLLTARLSPLTPCPLRFTRALGGQVLLVVAEKPDSAG